MPKVHGYSFSVNCRFLAVFSVREGVNSKRKEFVPIGTKSLTLLHSERPKLYTILALLSAKGLKSRPHFGGVLLPRGAHRKSQGLYLFEENGRIAWQMYTCIIYRLLNSEYERFAVKKCLQCLNR